jgi:hypothetical protein
MIATHFRFHVFASAEPFNGSLTRTLTCTNERGITLSQTLFAFTTRQIREHNNKSLVDLLEPISKLLVAVDPI